MRDLAWLRFKMQTGNGNQTATETETDTATSTATETRCRCMYLCPVPLPLSLCLPLCVDIFYTLPHSCAARINQATLLRLSIQPSAGALIASLVLELELGLHLASAELSWPPTCANCPHHCASFTVRIMAHWLQILFSLCLPLLLQPLVLTVPVACTVHHCVKMLLRGKFMCWSW